MILLSLALLVAAAVTLVVGALTELLALIYASIGLCLAAMVVLGLAVRLRRREQGHDTP